MFKRWSKVVSKRLKNSNDDKSNSNKDKLSSVVPNPTDNDNTTTSHETKREVLRNYIYSYLPGIIIAIITIITIITTIIIIIIIKAIFREKSSFSVGRYLMSYHLQYSLLMNTYSRTFDEFTFWMNGFHFASLVSASMFVLAVIFHLKYPSDNGKCSKYSLKHECLSEKIYNGQSLCTWVSRDVWTGCFHQEQDFDLGSLTFIAALQFLLLSPLCAMITFIFDRFIYAPLLSHFNEQKRKEAELLSDFIPISPPSLSSSSSPINKKPVIKTINFDNNFLDMRRRVFEVFQTSRSLPIDSNSNSNSNNSVVKDYSSFISSFNDYRNGLSDQKKILLDQKWSSVFQKDYRVSKKGTVTFRNSSHIIEELDSTGLEGELIYHHLKHSTTNTIGTELIKLFLLDILGRHSKDAKIFSSIIEKELRSEVAVSRGVKYLFIIIMIILNLYFLYATMLYSKGTGYNWQYHWVILFIVNICFDLGIGQPLTIYIKQYFIPITIKDTILHVRDTLDSLISMILKNSKYRSKKLNLFSVRYYDYYDYYDYYYYYYY